MEGSRSFFLLAYKSLYILENSISQCCDTGSSLYSIKNRQTLYNSWHVENSHRQIKKKNYRDAIFCTVAVNNKTPRLLSGNKRQYTKNSNLWRE
ncbi:hypothetical protein BDF14DRAFT_1777335 [Spinellus fusiger]|nr:hypothetical protein BDF14DRAFT_1777335 [Spinellus fusiger]